MWFFRSGSAKNTETLNEDYQRRVPLLSYFDLLYEKLGDPTAELDNNIRGISVMPDPTANTMTVAMFDKAPTSGNDRFKYKVRSFGADATGITQGRVTSQAGFSYPSETLLNVVVPPRHTFVLVGFSLNSTHSRDYHMKAIGAGHIESLPTLLAPPRRNYVVFDSDHSFNDDGNFEWDVRYALVPNNRLLERNGHLFVAKSSATGSVATTFETPPLGYVPVICGIHLHYSANRPYAHHKVRRIAAGNIPDSLNFEFAFHDKNFDDVFGYEMAYAFLKV